MPKSNLPSIKRRKLDDLIPYARNARTHTDEQIAQIAASITEFGWTNPILLNGSNGIIAGHGRVLAARKLGLDVVPCIELAHLTETQRQAYVLADNRLAELAGWDDDLLRLELVELDTAKFDLDLIGFGDFDLTVVDPDAAPEPQIDRAEELREQWGVERGQVWEVGRHRVMCGDATSEEDVAVLLDGAKPLLMVTDPPYGVEYDPAWRNVAAAEGKLAYAASRVGEVKNDDRADWSEAYNLFPGEVAYTWSPPGDHVIVTGAAMQVSGFQIRNQIIWRKPHFPISRGHYTYQHEPCWYGVRKGKKAHWIGDANASTIWKISLDKNCEGGHSTQKPLECMARPIRNHDAPEVYDPFVGSGTTAVAAEQLNRTCYGMEIAEKYVAVTLQRLADMGLEPKLIQ